jgi:hypothetical protein
MKNRNKYDALWIGAVPGIILPALTFIISWAIISDLSLGDYLEQFRKLNRIASLISLSTIPNLLLFFVFIWLNHYRSARGVIFSTIVLAMVMLIVKFA